MSAPDTNTEKERKRHKPALWSIKGGLALAGVLLLVYVGWLFIQTDGPEGADVQVQPGIGTEEVDG